MTLRTLAFSNIRGNLRSYSAFFMSSVFSVMIFYIYTAFLIHPDVANGHIVAAGKVTQGMTFCQYIIVIFSFLFALYSNSAFLKTRQQEFGLLSLFGMTRMQLRTLIIYENGAIALLSIGAGIGLGIAFSKLFYMALEVLLHMNEPIAFAVPLKALWLTAGGFFLLFGAISAWTAWRVGRGGIMDMLKASKEPGSPPVFSRWLAVLAVICLGAAYGMALIMNGANFVLLAPSVMVTVTIGTYLLFTQFSIMLLRFIQSNHRLYYRRTNLIIVAQLSYKMKTNARMLFIVSMLSAVIVTASGAVYMMGQAVFDGYKTQYEDAQSLMSLTMFIGMFISLLFFIAAGSIIYFKLFTELREDRAQCEALSRIGLTEDEIQHIVVMQMSMLFFVPCIVGIVHALIAMKVLDKLMMLSNWSYSFIVIGVYLLMQTIYFLITCHDYVNSLLRGIDRQRKRRVT